MFLINKLLRDTSEERLRKHNHENTTRERNFREKNNNLRKISRKRPNKGMNSVLTFNDGRLLNYKQNLHHRITLKRGIFPNAIQTNILSRAKGANQIKKSSPKREITPSISKEIFALRKDEKDEVAGDGKLINATSKTSNQTASSFVIASPREVSYSNISSLRTYNTPHTIPLSADSIHLKRFYGTSRTKIHKRGIDKKRLQFTVYTEEEALCNVMYKELSQVISKTMIIQNVTHFEDIPDPMDVLHDKLWKIRSLRDDNHEINFESDDEKEPNLETCNFQRMSVDVKESPARFMKNSFPLGKPSPEYREKNWQNNDDLFPHEKNKSLFEEDKFFDCFRENVTKKKNASKISPKCFLHCDKKMNERKYPDDKRFFDAKLFKESSHKDSRNLVYPSENRMHKFGAHKLSQRVCDSKKHSFNSALISTGRVEENLTLNPIRFLENISQDPGIEEKDRKWMVNPEMRFHKKDTSLSSPSFGMKLKSTSDGFHKRPNNSLRDIRQNEFQEVKKHALRLTDAKETCPTYDSNLIIQQCNFDKPAKESSSSQDRVSLMNRDQDLEYFLLPKAAKNTPEMKYYPYRLY